MSNKGVIKRYYPDRGYGFIKAIGHDNLFFHFSSVKNCPSKEIKVDMKVTFTIGKGRGGKTAAQDIFIIMPEEKEECFLNSATANFPLFLGPADTRAIIKPEHIDNYYLKLNKMAIYDNEKKKFTFYKTDRQNNEIINIVPFFSNIEFDLLAKRQRLSLQESNLKIIDFSFETDWRLVIGLGQESVYETSLTLHHIYGFPFIPASAVKGTVRNAIISELFGGDEEIALQDAGFTYLFGEKDCKGNIVFWDALPSSKPKITADVINPHYKQYYGDTSHQVAPVDYDDPNPVYFLSVEDTTFSVYAGINEYKNVPLTKGVFEGKNPLAVIQEWFEITFKQYGIGAKTSVGYGYAK